MHLNVPHIAQESQMSCWHASARMLYAYRRNASTHPLPNRYHENTGIGAAEFIALARAVGLRTLPKVNQSYGWQMLESWLKRYGPLWAAGQWNGANHIVVITGIDPNGVVYVNDPAFAAPVVRNIAWFNDKIDKNVDIPMMYLP